MDMVRDWLANLWHEKNGKIYVISFLLSCVGTFQYGYATTLLNTPVDQFKNFLNETKTDGGLENSVLELHWNLLLNIPFVGSIIGVFVNSLVHDKIGRRMGLICGSIGGLITSLLKYFSTLYKWYWWFFVARLLNSVTNCSNYSALLLILQESSPTHLRGRMSAMSELTFAASCAISMILGTNDILGNHLSALTAIPGGTNILLLIILFFYHETPKFLIHKKKDEEKTIKAIKFYHNLKDETQLKSVVDILKEESKHIKEAAGWFSNLKAIILTKQNLCVLFVSLACIQNTVGMWAFLNSSTYFLQKADVPTTYAQYSSTGMMFSYICGTICGVIISEKLKRRTLLLWCTGINVGSQVVYVAFDQLHYAWGPLKWLCLPCLAVYAFSYGSVSACTGSACASAAAAPVPFRVVLGKAFC